MVSKGRTHLRRAAEVVAVAQSDGVAQKMHVTGLGLTELGLWGQSADVFPHP